MKPGRTGALATGRMLLILGGVMVLVIGKGDIAVIAAGMFFALAGIYILSLVNTATKQFMGTGWPEKFCRIGAFIAGLLLIASGLVSALDIITDIYISENYSGLGILVISFLPFGWGLYILLLATNGVNS
jgi:predicted ABC-type exoprotein transport system permease subunit